jgi:hypothetical protein
MPGMQEEWKAQLFPVHWEYRVPSGAVYEGEECGMKFRTLGVVYVGPTLCYFWSWTKWSKDPATQQHWDHSQVRFTAVGSGLWLFRQPGVISYVQNHQAKVVLSSFAATLIGLVMDPQPNAEPEPTSSEAQGFEPNPMTEPTINSPRLMPEDMDVQCINEDTKLFAISQDLVEEHFMVMDDVSGCAGQCLQVSFRPPLSRTGIPWSF